VLILEECSNGASGVETGPLENSEYPIIIEECEKGRGRLSQISLEQRKKKTESYEGEKGNSICRKAPSTISARACNGRNAGTGLGRFSFLKEEITKVIRLRRGGKTKRSHAAGSGYNDSSGGEWRQPEEKRKGTISA